jgi:hypothetical protein
MNVQSPGHYQWRSKCEFRWPLGGLDFMRMGLPQGHTLPT